MNTLSFCLSAKMRIPPPEVMATWPTPNYVNPERRGPYSFIACCICFAVIAVVVPLRFYTRIRVSRNFGADDVLIGVGVVRVKCSLKWLRLKSYSCLVYNCLSNLLSLSSLLSPSVDWSLTPILLAYGAFTSGMCGLRTYLSGYDSVCSRKFSTS